MRIEQRTDGVAVRAPAKVNLYLEVLAKRTDGYHEIASVMVAVSLFDVLELTDDPSGSIGLECDHPRLGTGSDNLVMRAAQLLRKHSKTQHGVHIRLTKRIPMAAGLGGGSSDAAATLAGLNVLWGLGLSQTELADLGAAIGSDVAFFFTTPAAWCTGRGETVAPLPLGRPLDILLVCPGVGLATADVYRGVRIHAKPQSGEEIRQAVTAGDIGAIGRLLHNRLQPPAEQLCPLLADWRARLTALGPAGALMSGSGSTLFALCRDRREAIRIARDARGWPSQGMGLQMFIVRSCL